MFEGLPQGNACRTRKYGIGDFQQISQQYLERFASLDLRHPYMAEDAQNDADRQVVDSR